MVTDSELQISSPEGHKIAQALYHAVTGKTERMTRRFNDCYNVKFSDLEQLNAKFFQMCTQWHVLEQNSNITLYHLDENKEVFSSLERMRKYDQSQTSPVESVSFIFNVLIACPNGTKPQPYRITVRVLSTITLLNRMQNNMPPSSIIRFFTEGPIVVDVEYVDYVVARNMVSTFQSWVDEIQISEKNRYVEKLQKYSHWFARVSGALMVILASYASFQMTEKYLSTDSGDLLLAKFLIFSLAFVASASILGNWLGRLLESAIDSIRPLSYIRLNVGDERLITKFTSRNTRSWLLASVTFLLVSLNAIFNSVIASYVFRFLD